jgi:hypothetical protein
VNFKKGERNLAFFVYARILILDFLRSFFMPTISTFYGIIIRMFFKEHAPPHFHAQYGEQELQLTSKRLKLQMENYQDGR